MRFAYNDRVYVKEGFYRGKCGTVKDTAKKSVFAQQEYFVVLDEEKKSLFAKEKDLALLPPNPPMPQREVKRKENSSSGKNNLPPQQQDSIAATAFPILKTLPEETEPIEWAVVGATIVVSLVVLSVIATAIWVVIAHGEAVLRKECKNNPTLMFKFSPNKSPEALQNCMDYLKAQKKNGNLTVG